MTRTLVLLVAIVTLSGSPGAGQTAAAPGAYPIATAPEGLRPVIQRADLIIISLQDAVLSELTRELERGGAAGAIKACHLDATAAAYRLSREHGVNLGRTSDRLRNPTNAPRPWAAGIVRQYAGRRAADVEGFAVDLGDRVGVLRPIALRPMCTACHGAPDELDPRIEAELKERYPKDRAVGFRPGDVRGWFWVEIPKK